MKYLILILSVIVSGCSNMSLNEKKCALKHPNYDKQQRAEFCHKFNGFREVWK